MNGLKVILDVESFDYAFTDRGALGFRIALTDARDQAAIYQDSSNIFPGKKTQYQQNTFHFMKRAGVNFTNMSTSSFYMLRS
jgi:hypothetical protein